MIIGVGESVILDYNCGVIYLFILIEYVKMVVVSVEKVFILMVDRSIKF